MNQPKRFYENSVNNHSQHSFHHHSHHHQSHQQPQQQPHQHYHHYQLSNQPSNTHQLSSSLPTYSTIAIKSEPQTNYTNYNPMETTRDNSLLTTAMPIPRSGKMLNSDFSFDFDQSQSPQITQDGSFGASPGPFGQPTPTNSNTMWSIIGDAMTLSKSEPFTLDDDDIFQVDKADLLQGPTLAELNDDAILEDMNFDDFMMPAENPSGLLLLNNSTNFQINSFNETSVPPQQLLQSQHHSGQQQGAQAADQQQHSSQMPIAIGRDALLYDEQTNTSSSPYDIYQSPPPKSVNSSAAFSPGSQASSSSPLLVNSVSPPPYVLNNNTINLNNNSLLSGKGSIINNNNESISRNKAQYTTLQELLKQEPSVSPERNEYGQSVPGPSTMSNVMRNRHESSQNRRMQFIHQHSGGSSSRLSSSCPTNSSAIWEAHQIWQRREPRQHLLSTSSMAEAGSTSSLSTGGILSPDGNDYSHDEEYDDSDSDALNYDDFSSDNGKSFPPAPPSASVLSVSFPLQTPTTRTRRRGDPAARRSASSGSTTSRRRGRKASASSSRRRPRTRTCSTR